MIIYATWVPQPLEPETLPEIPGLDKVIHAVMTGGLLGALVFDTTRRQHWQPLSRRTMVWLALGAALFGIVDEVVQGLLPIGRPSDPLDLLADWAGVLVAYFAAPPAVNAIGRHFRSRR